VSTWRATKARRVYAALLRIGWTLKKQVGRIGSCSVRAGPTSHSAFTTAKKSAPPRSPRSGRTRGFALKISDPSPTWRYSLAPPDSGSISSLSLTVLQSFCLRPR
jgi:hypothetical protein